MGTNLLVGLSATIVALLQVAGWMGLGSLVFPPSGGNRPVAAGVVAGASITGALSAVLCWFGLVPVAIAASAILSLGCLILRREAVLDQLRSLAAECAAVAAGRPAVRWIAGAALAVAWALTVAPPRDADVMRYHLAHIRQILQDGAWLPIADYHYALPFGWSINYLPFEAMGLPEAVQVMNLLLFLMAIVTLVSALRPISGNGVALWIAALLVFQPSLLKAATTASADTFMLFVVTAIVGVLVAPAASPATTAASLGFLAWIGLQSRYQAAAIAMSATAAWIVGVWGRRERVAAAPFLVGAAGGLVLSAPFYLVNLASFRNPFWPVFIGLFSPASSYSDAVAAWYNGVLGGARSFATLAAGLTRALRSPEVFPIPWVCLILLVLAVFYFRRMSLAVVQMLVMVFGYLAIWAAMQPTLYARFFVYVAPPALAAVGLLSGRVGVGSVVGRRGAMGLVVTWTPVVALAAVCAWYSQDGVRYFVNRDEARYHRSTWFYEPETWLNANTPPGSRVLVMLDSAQTYYLERPYRRADPCWSAVVDWRAVRTPADLNAVLRDGGYQYVLYQEHDWSICPGGRNLMGLVRDARAAGDLHELRSFDLQLSAIRMLRTFMSARVVIFGVDGTTGVGGPSPSR